MTYDKYLNISSNMHIETKFWRNIYCLMLIIANKYTPKIYTFNTKCWVKHRKISFFWPKQRNSGSICRYRLKLCVKKHFQFFSPRPKRLMTRLRFVTPIDLTLSSFRQLSLSFLGGHALSVHGFSHYTQFTLLGAVQVKGMRFVIFWFRRYEKILLERCRMSWFF